MTKFYDVNDCKDCTALWLCMAYGPPEYQANPSEAWQAFCGPCNSWVMCRYINGVTEKKLHYEKIKLPKRQTCTMVSDRKDFVCDECKEEIFTIRAKEREKLLLRGMQSAHPLPGNKSDI